MGDTPVGLILSLTGGKTDPEGQTSIGHDSGEGVVFLSLQITRGNLLNAKAEALVNTVNCVGIMGKGIALQFKQAYPDNYAAYKKACDRKEVRPGKVMVVSTGSLFDPKFIINFPTNRMLKN